MINSAQTAMDILIGEITHTHKFDDVTWGFTVRDEDSIQCQLIRYKKPYKMNPEVVYVSADWKDVVDKAEEKYGPFP